MTCRSIRGPRLMLLAALAALALPGVGRAGCAGQDSWPRTGRYAVDQEFQRSRYVATVKVTGETWVAADRRPRPLEPPFEFSGTRPWDSAAYIGVFYDLQVLSGLKGDPPPTLRVFSVNTAARAPMTVGRSYLAFMDETAEPLLGGQPTHHIDACGNSTGLQTAKPLLRRVRALVSPRPSSAPR